MERKNHLSRLTSAKVLTVFVLLCVMLFALSSKAWACTGIYVGPEASEDLGLFVPQTSAWFSFKELNTLCVEKEDRPVYGDPVRAYWKMAEAETQSCGIRR